MSAFPDTELKSQQITVHSVPHAEGFLAAVIEHPAVVTGKDDQRIVRDTFLFKRRHDLANDPVQLVDEVTIQAALTGSLKTWSRRKRMMDVGRGEVEKKWLVRLFADPLGCSLDQRRPECEVVVEFVRRGCAAKRVGNAVAVFFGQVA